MSMSNTDPQVSDGGVDDDVNDITTPSKQAANTTTISVISDTDTSRSRGSSSSSSLRAVLEDGESMRKMQASIRTADDLYRTGFKDDAISAAFEALDLDGSGQLHRREIFACLRIAADHVRLDVEDEVIEAATDALLEDVAAASGGETSAAAPGEGEDDGDGDGGEELVMTQRQFFELFRRHPELMTVFEDEEMLKSRRSASLSLSLRTSSEKSEAEVREDQRLNEEVWEHARVHWKNRGIALVWLFLYFAANVIAFTYKAVKYARNEEALAVFGNCICVARGAAQALNLNACIILLPICRHFLTFLRSTRLRWVFPFDASIEVHILCGAVLACFATAHVAAHMCDFVRFSHVPAEDIYALFGDKLGTIPESPRARWGLLLSTPAGVTGIFMTVCMIVAYPCVFVRRSKFNLFWGTHHLLLLMLVALCLHGISSLLEPFQSVYWVMVPMVLYLVPRCWRETPCSAVAVREVRVKKPGDVVQLVLERPERWWWKKRVEAGMYAFINIPRVSRLEWHPFTLTSSPSVDFVEFHFKRAGDWTGAVLDVLDKEMADDREEGGGEKEWVAPEGTPSSRSPRPPLPVVKLEGPIGASSQGFSDYPVIVLVGAGIGITPMISVLRELLANPGKMKRTFFYWTTRDRSSFEWFADVMDDIYDADQKHVLQVRHFLTSAREDDRDLGAVLLKYATRARHRHTEMDLILGRRTHHQVEVGRPDWEDELRSVREEATELGLDDCGVFLCGPERMAEALDETSFKLSKQDKSFHFYFTKETF